MSSSPASSRDVGQEALVDGGDGTVDATTGQVGIQLTLYVVCQQPLRVFLRALVL